MKLILIGIILLICTTAQAGMSFPLGQGGETPVFETYREAALYGISATGPDRRGMVIRMKVKLEEIEKRVEDVGADASPLTDGDMEELRELIEQASFLKLAIDVSEGKIGSSFYAGSEPVNER